MTAPFEEKYHNFAQYLRGRQAQFYAKEMLDDIPDDVMLESYRKNPKDDSYFYTEDQEKSIIMEYESNEAIANAFEKLQHLSHRESLEKEIIEEFKLFINPVTVEGCEGLDSTLFKLNKMDIKLEIKDLNITVINAISIFPYWIIMGNNFYVSEEEPFDFCMDYDDYCSTCLLNETLHKYKTMLGWSRYTYTDFFDEEEMSPEVFQTRIIGYIQKDVVSLISKYKSDTLENTYKSIAGNPKLMHQVNNLLEIILNYIMELSLISCWVHGKERALEEEKKTEEASEVLKQTHEYFCEKYKNCLKSGDMKPFFEALDNFLKPLSLEQLEILDENGFPLENLAGKTLTKINRAIAKYIKIKTKFPN
jgi:hypothetical protein